MDKNAPMSKYPRNTPIADKYSSFVTPITTPASLTSTKDQPIAPVHSSSFHCGPSPKIMHRIGSPDKQQQQSSSRFSRSLSSHSLEAVPEERRNSESYTAEYQRLQLQKDDKKGKSRAMSAGSASNQEGKWVIDLLEAAQGREKWMGADRVILILGDMSADALFPLLYNPSFVNTVLLIGTTRPVPSIEALPGSSSRIYPSLQIFSVPPTTVSTAQHLPYLLETAIDLSKNYRAKRRSGPSIWSRRSSDTSELVTPPLTPPLRPRYLSASGPSSRSSLDRTIPEPASLPSSRPTSWLGSDSRPGSEGYLTPTKESANGRNRLSSFRRESIFGALPIFGEPDSMLKSSLPFDAVINFIPSTTKRNAQIAMTQLLHQAVLITAGVTPILQSKLSSSSAEKSIIPLLHVLPTPYPIPLPGALENFLQSALPAGAEQTITPYVLPRRVWSATSLPLVYTSDMDTYGTFSPIETVLFGGLAILKGFAARAWLPDWNDAVFAPGLNNLSRSTSPSKGENVIPKQATDGESGNMDRSDSIPGLETSRSLSSSSCSSGDLPVETAIAQNVEEAWRRTHDGTLVRGEEVKGQKGVLGWFKRKGSAKT